MEGFTIIGPTAPRPLSYSALLAERLNRVTDEEINNRIVKLKSDVNVAVHKIDTALQRRHRKLGSEHRHTPHHRPTAYLELETRGTPDAFGIERSVPTTRMPDPR